MSIWVLAGDRRVRRVFGGAVLAVAIVAATPPGIASSRAAMSTSAVAASFKLAPVAGSGRYLIYTKLGVQADGHYTGRGELLVMTSNGVSRRLTTITQHDISFSLAGDSLVYVEDSRLTVHWWNIVTNAHRSFLFHDNASIHQRLGALGAAPHGVLVGEDDSTHPNDLILEVDRFDGTLHPLDAPFPKSKSYSVAEANGRIVVADVNNSPHDGVVKLVTFTKPGHNRTLARTGLGAHDCPSVTRDYVACQISPNESAKNPPNSMHLLSTDGRRSASTTKGCPSAYAAVLGSSAAWIVPTLTSCPAHYLWTLGINGAVSRSTRTYSSMRPIAAFHEVVVADRSRHSLDELSSAKAKPHVLVHVK